ncbi:hypothetical protein ACFX16_029010 [Malus domestica]
MFCVLCVFSLYFFLIGAKIHVYGTKAGTGHKAEIKSSDGTEIQGEYENLYVHISADTFEKVDAAVAVIELLGLVWY